MTDDAGQEKPDYEKRWEEMDFSWEGLADGKALKRINAPKDFPTNEDGRELWRISLQQYWRWSRHVPGYEQKNRLLTDEELVKAGLVAPYKKKLFHLIHHPAITEDQERILDGLLSMLVFNMCKNELKEERIQLIGSRQAQRAIIIFKKNTKNKDVLSKKLLINASYSIISSFNANKIIFGENACFDDAVFGKNVIFHGAVFEKRASFTGATFGDIARFDSASFENSVSFTNATFGNQTYFNYTTFGEKTSFKGATFGDAAWFEAASFGSRTSFHQATFGERAAFERATFGDHISFYSAVFGKGASFYCASFGKQCSFQKTTFGQQALFGRSSFDTQALFNDATFGESAWFDGATFGEKTRFHGAVFGERASFNITEFGAHTSFQGANFGKQAWFGSAIFGADSFFGGATFDDATSFQGASFNGKAFFNTTSFNGSTFFNHANFNGYVNFGHSVWNTDTHFHRTFLDALFRDVANFETPNFSAFAAFDGATFEKKLHLSDPAKRSGRAEPKELFRRACEAVEAYIPQKLAQKRPKQGEAEEKQEETEADHEARRTAIAEEAWSALAGGYRTVKQAMEAQGDFDRQQRYYRFEVQARLKRPSTTMADKVVAWFYGTFSDYGSSFARPFCGLLGLLIAFATLYLSIASILSNGALPLIHIANVLHADGYSHRHFAPLAQETVTGTWQALEFSLVNTFRPLYSLSANSSPLCAAGPSVGKTLLCGGSGIRLLVQFLSALQSFLAIVLAFLFALAVRRKFQIS